MNNVYDRILRSIHGLTTIPCQTSSVTQRHWAVKKSPERWGNEFLLECCWLWDCFDFGPDDVRHPNRTPSNWFNPIAWHRTVSGDPLETKKHIQFAHHSSSQFESVRTSLSQLESIRATTSHRQRPSLAPPPNWIQVNPRSTPLCDSYVNIVRLTRPCFARNLFIIIPAKESRARTKIG